MVNIKQLSDLIVKEMADKQGLILKNLKFISKIDNFRYKFSATINGCLYKIKYTSPHIYYGKWGENLERVKNIFIKIEPDN